MTQRRCKPIIFAIALPAFLGMTLSSCTSPESDSSRETSPLPETTETVEPEDSDTPVDSQSVAGITNVETASDATTRDSSSSAESNSTKNGAAGSDPSPSKGGDSPSAEPEPKPKPTEPKSAETQAKDAEKPEIAAISIDETVCGAGGQEAYFETRVQEIYICKNAESSLTYIATPKRKGNSFFLPAQKIQQGDLVGYAAIDETKTYIVTPGGFQLQENGKSTKSEKVIRRQLAKE